MSSKAVMPIDSKETPIMSSPKAAARHPTLNLSGHLDGRAALLTLQSGAAMGQCIPVVDSVADIAIRQADLQSSAWESSGLFFLPVVDELEDWISRFWMAYQQRPDFRGYANERYRLPSLNEGPDLADHVEVSGYDNLVALALAPGVAALIKAGCMVMEAKAGSSISPACLRTKARMPEELVEAMTAAGFVASDDARRIHTNVSEVYPEIMLAASGVFCRVVNDWAAGELVKPLQSYQRWRPLNWPDPFIALPCDDKGTANARRVGWQAMRLARLDAWGHARLNDFHQLRSGRDHYSQMKEGDLLAALSEPDGHHIQVLETWEEEHRLRALRWMCRGLPTHVAMKKVWLEIQYAERQRERAKGMVT